jgi:hypothetical protein
VRRPLRLGLEAAPPLLLVAEGLAPLPIFGLALSAGDALALILSVTAGYALIRVVLSALHRLGSWAPPAMAGLVVVAIAIGGLWRGPVHPASLLLGAGALVPAVARLSLGSTPTPRRRGALLGALGLGALLAFVLVDANVLSVFPRYQSALLATLSATLVFTFLSALPPLPSRASLPTLGAAAATALALLLIAPDASLRTGGHLRRQAELAFLVHPHNWLAAVRPAPMIKRADPVRPPRGDAAVVIDGQARPANVLLLSIDAMRADLFQPDDARTAFPHLSRLMDDACRVDVARTPSAYTHLTLPALYNGGFDHLARPMFGELAEATGANAACVGVGYCGEYTGGTPMRAGVGHRAITDALLQEVESARRAGRPFFITAHYLDVHLPKKRDLAGQLTSDPAGYYRDRLAEVDTSIGRIVDALKASGAWERTLLVVTADHGEEVNERGYGEHAFHLYETILRVPLIVRAPTAPCGDPSTPASLLDVIPLVAAELGVTIASPKLEGSWPPRGGAHTALSTFYGPFIAIVDDEQKIIFDVRYGDLERYDLRVDPGETHNLATRDDLAVVKRALSGRAAPRNPFVKPFALLVDY